MLVDGIVWAETCGIYGGINVVISWKGGERGRQAEEEGEASCFVRRRWEGQGMAGKEGKGGILAEVSLPPPIYCLWLFCDEREILETVSRSVVLRGKISLCPVFSLIRAFSGRFQTESLMDNSDDL